MPETMLDFNNSARLLKSKVTLRQVIESYGIKLDGHHICCPLHHEKNPSFKLYKEDTDEGNFYCFGCQKSGDIISFVSFKEGITPGQALHKISKAFNVPLVTKDISGDSLTKSLELILKKKEKEVPKEVSELVHWQILADKVYREFESLEALEVPYLRKKQLPHIETKSKYDILIVPMRDVDDQIWSFQQIQADGMKVFLKGGRKEGLMLRLGPLSTSFAFICEGWATAATVYLCTGVTTYVAFTAGNIDKIVHELQDKYPTLILTVAGDNDEAGHMHHQHAIYPRKYKQDWWDVMQEEGAEKVKKYLIG